MGATSPFRNNKRESMKPFGPGGPCAPGRPCLPSRPSRPAVKNEWIIPKHCQFITSINLQGLRFVRSVIWLI